MGHEKLQNEGKAGMDCRGMIAIVRRQLVDAELGLRWTYRAENDGVSTIILR
jgi:hypothetical protein